MDRVAWFQDLVAERGDENNDVSDEDLQTLAMEFVKRYEEELVELKAQRRPGRPPSTQEDRIRQQQDVDLQEFKGGLWIPDIRTEAGREKLGNWNGDWSGLNTLKFVRVIKDGAVRDSSFPPKGLS